MNERAEALDSPSNLEFPGKVFLFGEYGVLCGLPAFLFPVRPAFQWTRDVPRNFEGTVKTPSEFALQSPAGKLWNELPLEAQKVLEGYSFLDPYSGQGGLGGSTAEFAGLASLSALFWSSAAFSKISRLNQSQEVWSLYRRLTHEAGTVAPSGADLVLQYLDRIIRFQSSPTPSADSFECSVIDSTTEDFLRVSTRLLLFSAAHQSGRKVATHEHLPKLKSLMESGELRRALQAPIDHAWLALDRKDRNAFGASLSAFAIALQKLGLEFSLTRRELDALQRIPGVLGAKGTGAMQADALVCLVERERGTEILEHCLEWAQQHDLRCLLTDWPVASQKRETDEP